MMRCTKLAAIACTASLAALLGAHNSAGAQQPDKQARISLGIEHRTARDLYQYFLEDANGGEELRWRDVPDWSGVWTRETNIFLWDRDQGSPDAPSTAKLTPEYQAMLDAKLEGIRQGIEYDPLSAGNPAGMPRWLAEPFLKEFAVTPDQTWLMNEMMNEIRRVYTDGRGHPPPEDAYPLWLGDSIGFWDDDRLIIHTTQMRDGQYQRVQPHYSDQIETVEIWQKIDDETIAVEIWCYDPPALLEPWYTYETFKKLSNDDHSLRVRYWHFNENQNNDVIVNEEGTSDFADFSFTDDDNQ